MKYITPCLSCNKMVEFETTGRIEQFTGDAMKCPCDDQAPVVPRYMEDLDSYVLIPIALLEPSAEVGAIAKKLLG